MSAVALAVAGLVGVAAAPAHAATTMDLAYVLDPGPHVVRVVDVATSTIVGSIPVGLNPTGIVVSPDKRTAYVPHYGGPGQDDTVEVIDTATGTRTHVIGVCRSPEVAAMSPDGSELWVGCSDGDISVIYTPIEAVTDTIAMGAAPTSLVFSPDGFRVFATHGATATGPAGIDLIYTGGVVLPLAADAHFGAGLLVSPDASKLFVGEQGSDSVAVMDTDTGAVTATIPMGGSTDSGVLNPTGTAAYYCVNGTTIDVVDLASGSVIRTLAVACGDGSSTAASLTFAPGGNTLYADLGVSGLSVIDVPTGTVTARLLPGPLLGSATAVGFVQAAIVPAVSAVSPAQGPDTGGTRVVITGGPFVGGGGATAVSFGGVPATSFTVDSDSQITAVAPPHFATSRVDVAVTNGNGTSLASAADQYLYVVALPTVTSLSPSSGVSSGGTTVVITGTDFTTARSVYFGGTAASSFTVDSDTQITAVTRAQHNGTVPVTVTDNAGLSTVAQDFTFFSPVPVVTAISPGTGTALGGDQVTITGMRFTGTFRVMFGGVAVPYTLNSDSQITVVTPPWSSLMTPAAGTASPSGSAGPVDVQVTTDVDTSAVSSADVFDYVAPA